MKDEPLALAQVLIAFFNISDALRYQKAAIGFGQFNFKFLNRVGQAVFTETLAFD